MPVSGSIFVYLDNIYCLCVETYVPNVGMLMWMTYVNAEDRGDTRVLAGAWCVGVPVRERGEEVDATATLVRDGVQGRGHPGPSAGQRHEHPAPRRFS